MSKAQKADELYERIRKEAEEKLKNHTIVEMDYRHLVNMLKIMKKIRNEPLPEGIIFPPRSFDDKHLDCLIVSCHFYNNCKKLYSNEIRLAVGTKRYEDEEIGRSYVWVMLKIENQEKVIDVQEYIENYRESRQRYFVSGDTGYYMEGNEMKPLKPTKIIEYIYEFCREIECPFPNITC